ncbi:MAG: Hpt domain-containing protein [Rhodobacteraceae bacterium]|nr:Hpt domain-containing protein [Paracoccaceae bacterium]
MILWSRVNELRDEVGAEDFDEVVELFMEEVGDAIEHLRSDAGGDLEQALHFLKGSALSLGFEAFSDACQQGEREAAAGHAARVDIGAIIAIFERSRTEFLSGLPLHGPV